MAETPLERLLSATRYANRAIRVRLAVDGTEVVIGYVRRGPDINTDLAALLRQFADELESSADTKEDT